MTNQYSAHLTRNAWRDSSMMLILLLIFLLVFYASTWWSMINIWWHSDTYIHSFLILPFSAYLIFKQRHSLLTYLPTGAWLPVLFLFFTVLLWFLGEMSRFSLIQHFAVVSLLPLLIWTILGTTAVKTISFPLFFLFFLVPFGETLIPYLQDFTAYFSVRFLQLINIPVYWEGRYIYIPSGSFVVEEACSGVRYLEASLAVGAIYAYMMYTQKWRRLLFLSLAVVIPIIANGLRAVMIILMAHYSNMRLATGADHLVYGWLFFGLVMFFLFWLGKLFWEKKITAAQSLPPLVLAGGSASVAGGLNYKKSITVSGVAAILLLMAPALVAWNKLNFKPAPLATQLPQPVGQWQGPFPSSSDWKPDYAPGVTQLQAQYQHALHGVVVVFLGFYAPNNPAGGELINAQNKIYTAPWKRVDEVFQEQPLVVQTQIQRGLQQQLVWHWYEIMGTSVTNAFAGKYLEAKQRLLQKKEYNLLIALAVPMEEGRQVEAQGRLQAFILDMHPALSAMATGKNE